MYFTGKDIPKISPNKFRYDNSFWYNQLGLAAICLQGTVTIDPEWELIGVCADIGDLNRKDSVALMLFHSEHGEKWQHYPNSGYEYLPWKGRLVT